MGGGFRQDQWVGVDAEDLSQQNSMWNGLTLNLNLIIVVCLFFCRSISFDLFVASLSGVLQSFLVSTVPLFLFFFILHCFFVGSQIDLRINCMFELASNASFLLCPSSSFRRKVK